MAAAFFHRTRLRKVKPVEKGMLGMSAVPKLFTDGNVNENALYWAIPPQLRIDLLKPYNSAKQASLDPPFSYIHLTQNGNSPVFYGCIFV